MKIDPSKLNDENISTILLKRFNRMNLKYKVLLIHMLKYGTDDQSVGEAFGLNKEKTIKMFTSVKTSLLKEFKNE